MITTHYMDEAERCLRLAFISNVQLFDEKSNKGTRTKNVVEGDTKVRVGVKSGTKFSAAGM